MFICMEQIMRPYCDSDLTILCSMHRYFAGISTKESSQIKMVEKYIHLAFHKNAMRARDDRSPLTVEECRQIARESLGEACSRHLGEEKQGDPFTKEDTEREKQVTEVGSV